MPEISKIKLPSGSVYDIKDSVARQAIAGGVAFIISWDGTSIPIIANIPAGVTVTYQGTQYIGTLAASASQPGAFYLVKSSSEEGTLDKYDEYVAVSEGTSKSWEKLGDTSIDLSIFGDLAYKDAVAFNKGTGDNVLGENTTFSASASAVTFSGGQSKNAIGTGATFDTSVTLTKSNVSVPVVSSNTQRSIPNVTNVGAASTWSFQMGSGDDSETLIIGGANGTAPSLGTAITATDTAFGDDVTATNVTGANASTTVNSSDTVNAITNLGTGSAAAQNITVGNNDVVKVAKYDDLNVQVS